MGKKGGLEEKGVFEKKAQYLVERKKRGKPIWGAQTLQKRNSRECRKKKKAEKVGRPPNGKKNRDHKGPTKTRAGEKSKGGGGPKHGGPNAGEKGGEGENLTKILSQKTTKKGGR